jgi:choline dehydrogenase-like flavoprotein
VYCAHCLDGCPYDHIYNSAQTITALARAGEIQYRPQLHVDRVSERDGEVLVEATPVGGASSGEPGVTMRARRAFVAAGAVSSTVLMQRSGLLGERALIADSQALYVPFAWLGRIGRTGREPGHTLAQASLVLEDPTVSSEPVHITLYTYNDGLSERARASHPGLTSLLGPGLEAITRRLVIGICFFHSQDSDGVAVRARPDSRSVRLEAVINPRTRPTMRRFQAALARTLGRVGLFPLAPLSELAPAGGGYHYGGSIPMRSAPGFGETDALGRPAGTARIHVVDSSCFPTVPGGAITFSSMANAQRIVNAAVEEDRGAGVGDVGARARPVTPATDSGLQRRGLA